MEGFRSKSEMRRVKILQAAELKEIISEAYDWIRSADHAYGNCYTIASDNKCVCKKQEILKKLEDTHERLEIPTT